MGRAHAVSEAWIDDLGRVVLDGQNGMYWVDADGRPLGLLELRRLRHAREPGRQEAGRVPSDAWWPYVHTVGPTGLMISPPPYAPLLERVHVQSFDQLVRDTAGSS